MPEGRGSYETEDERIIRSVLKTARTEDPALFDKSGAPDATFADFIRQTVHYATGDTDYRNDIKALYRQAKMAWTASQTRKPGEDLVIVRADDAKGDWRQARVILEVVTDDKPFLVDSITGALSEMGKNVSFFLNAVIDSYRDENGVRKPYGEGRLVREAVIHAEMDPAVDDSELPAIEREIRAVLADVGLAVEDWEPMRARLASCIAALERGRPVGVDREELQESVAFLKWLWDNRFAFLGARRFLYAKTDKGETWESDPEGDLGILRDPTRRVIRTHLGDGKGPGAAVKAFLESSEPLIVAKANAKSIVHRRAYMDYIGVKIYNAEGQPIGEERFVGLFTADAYNRPATDIPLLRRKISLVVERASFVQGGHNEKALVNILETFPRDELFQVNVDDLIQTGLGILRLYKRPRTKLFLRRDRFNRFVSAIVYVPRDRYNSSVREEVGEILRSTFNGRISAYYPSFNDGPLARVHYIIGLDPGAPKGPPVEEIEARIAAAVRTWADDLKEALRKLFHGAPPPGVFATYERAFSGGYMELNDADQALADIQKIETLSDETPFALRAYRRPGDDDSKLRLKIYRRDEPIALSDFIPILENLGMDVLHEDEHPVRPNARSGASKTYWIHDFCMRVRVVDTVDFDAVRTIFEETCAAVLRGETEDDLFNALVVAGGLNWREAAVLRACAKYNAQARFPFSLEYMAQTLHSHPQITKLLNKYFHARLHPHAHPDASAREREEQRIRDEIYAKLDDVASLDEDRIIRRFANLITVISRTNYYQKTAKGESKPYLSFKIISSELDELPDPKPYAEIFVSSPRVDGVHLRFGPVARGGLRWSDRREDFRTEVLGLVKAQQVKNTVIVPVGAKGGFYPKQLPKDGDREAVFAEGKEAYKQFISGLLDVTDNIVKGEIKPPQNVVRRDGDDPYLVVAADKGTATFSDTANEIAKSYGFWLGDAFASGGSAGYDHKAMGITARGAWEAVKRHFREMGVDIQKEPFKVIGIGDMSGDVFGNGMLLSRQIKLIAAFDHRDIFIDPNPDPETSYRERERLFKLPRSSWQDYDKELISAGGGVFSRSQKSIPLSAEMRRILKMDAAQASPNDIIRAILRAETDLFWMGGIGTYYRASFEENWRVGDRANDHIRVPVTEAGAKVIGEGGNLGLTQEARIEFADRGGRINTDAVDNSAGVDSSDHEVNIKILLDSAIAAGALKESERNALLASMTDDVAAHVLVNNYDQTLAISLEHQSAPADLDAQGRFMLALEHEGRLNRAIENLPTVEQISELKVEGRGLARPEICVLLAYSKMWLFDAILESQIPDDRYFDHYVKSYFPEALQKFDTQMAEHRLRREIIATKLANRVANRGGLTFAFRVTESTGRKVSEVVKAYEIAEQVFGFEAIVDAINKLDNQVSADLQYALHKEAVTFLRRQIYWLVSARNMKRIEAAGSVSEVISRFKPGMETLKPQLLSTVPASVEAQVKRRAKTWQSAGAPEQIAREVALMEPMTFAPDVIDISLERGWSTSVVSRLYFKIGAELGFDELRSAATESDQKEHFDRLAIRKLVEDLQRHQRTLAESVLDFADGRPQDEPDAAWAEELFAAWIEANAEAVGRVEQIMDSMELKTGVSVGKLALASRQFRELAASVI